MYEKASLQIEKATLRMTEAIQNSQTMKLNHDNKRLEVFVQCIKAFNKKKDIHGVQVELQ